MTAGPYPARVPRRAVLLTGVAGLVAAAALAVWPLSADGAAGNALRPQYGSFGWTAYAPLPEDASLDDLRAAGVDLPQDVVAGRRTAVAGLGLAGVVLVGSALRRPSGPRRRRR